MDRFLHTLGEFIHCHETEDMSDIELTRTGIEGWRCKPQITLDKMALTRKQTQQAKTGLQWIMYVILRLLLITLVTS